MQANFTLEKNNQIVLKKILEEGPNGMEFFLVMFKKILQKENSVIIHGAKDLSYLPLQINFTNNNGQLTINNL